MGSNSGKIKNIIIGLMAVVIILLVWIIFRGNAGRYCQPVGIGKMPERSADTITIADTLRR